MRDARELWQQITCPVLLLWGMDAKRSAEAFVGDRMLLSGF